MRQAAQVKSGFYPIDPAGVAFAASRLMAPAGRPFTILDPCAGEGMAIKQLGEALTCPHLCAIELDEGRGAIVKANLPGAQVLAPASIFGCEVSYGSLSLLWLNPPFDDEIGGGDRTETEFLRKATPWLRVGGVLCLVCPAHVASKYGTMGDYLRSYYEQITIVELPEDIRKYEEVIVFAVRRKEPVEHWKVEWKDVKARDEYVYRIPASDGLPRKFLKVEPTDTELRRMLDASPLRRILETTTEPPLPRPPMPINAGHRAMMLAAGHLDGLVCPPREKPHVVRGTARKVEYVKSEEVLVDSDGNETGTKTVKAEKVNLIVRVVDSKGDLHTLMEE